MSRSTNKTKIIRYWHPGKGGWYYGRLMRSGRKWGRVKPLGIGRNKRVAMTDIREALWGNK